MSIMEMDSAIIEEAMKARASMHADMNAASFATGDNVNTEMPEELKSAEMAGNSGTMSPRAAKPRDSTHNHIFGEPPPSPRKSGKIFHMTSDIFGVGSIVDRSGQHVSTRDSFDTQLASSSFADKIGAADMESSEQGSGRKFLPGVERKPNARENGCNPVTGDGYADVDGGSGNSKRRQYPQRRTQSLW